MKAMDVSKRSMSNRSALQGQTLSHSRNENHIWNDN